MKIAVISYSGNVGKSTLATQVLKPRLPGAKLINVETVNAHPNAERASFNPVRYGDLLVTIAAQTEAIIDIGASSAKIFLDQAATYDSLTNDYDLFVIPATPDEKVLADTAATVEHLNRLGVAGDSIACIPSRIVDPEDIRYAFMPLTQLIDEKHIACQFLGSTPFLEREVFARLRSANQSLESYLSDDTDWAEKLRAAKKADERTEYAGQLITSRLARGAKQNLDDVYTAIVGAIPQQAAKATA